MTQKFYNISTKTIILPNNSYIKAYQQGNLPILNLSSKAKNTKIFNRLNHSLISLGQLSDDGYTIVLKKN